MANGAPDSSTMAEVERCRKHEPDENGWFSTNQLKEMSYEGWERDQVGQVDVYRCECGRVVEVVGGR